MKIFGILALLAMAACVTTTSTGSPDPRGVPPPREKSSDELRTEREVQQAFEAWQSATANGDVKAHYEGMTANNISHWLWQRVEDHSDPLIARWLPLLPPAARNDLEEWRAANNKYAPDRAELLPASLLQTEWLPKLYAEYFKQSFQFIRRNFETLKVKSVAVEKNVATVVTGTSGQSSEMYVMVPGLNGGWLVDGYVPPRKPS